MSQFFLNIEKERFFGYINELSTNTLNLILTERVYELNSWKDVMIKSLIASRNRFLSG